MVTELPELQNITFTVPAEKIGSYTTLLQSGIFLESEIGEPIGIFMDKLPGFNMEYIVDRIQTIFLDGNALDDMETPFSNSSPVLALSAAMPGLAGAIFRRNSLHAALRTSESKTDQTVLTESNILVCLKLFNMIAAEKGPGILEQGGCFSGSTLHNFFHQRPELQQNIIHIEMDNGSIPAETLWTRLEPSALYHVTILSA